ncbi:hypothetical protein ACEPAH_7614 [Sanghuangporus vaninii]
MLDNSSEIPHQLDSGVSSHTFMHGATSSRDPLRYLLAISARPKPDKLHIPYEASIFAPLYISHVCRAWRSLVLAYGDPWSYAWLSRTNGPSISYVFRCGFTERFDVEDHRHAECMITTLLSQQYRWRDVDFAWCNVNVSVKFPGLDMTNMPSLASISLHVELPMHATISIAQSSRLKTLDLFDTSDLSIIGEPMCPIGSRIELSSKYGCTGSRAVETSLDILKNAPSLTRFGARSTSSLVYSDRSHHHPRLILPSLRALKLGDGEVPAIILDSVTSSSLEALYYASSVKKGLLFSFFLRSKPPLTFLRDSCAGEDDIFGILRMLSYLKDLRYSNAFVSKRFFRELAVEMRENEEIALSAEHAICTRLDIVHLHNLQPLNHISECLEILLYMMKYRESSEVIRKYSP